MDTALLPVLERSQRLGFLGPGPVGAHVDHARQLVGWFDACVPTGGSPRAMDLGSGGGVPGLVLACALPRWHFVLLDSLERRCAFLVEAIATLGLGDRVAVHRARAEEAGHDAALREQFDVVVARSFGPPAVTAECGSAFVRVGGALVVSEPPERETDRWPADGLGGLGLVPDELIGSWRIIRKQEPTPARFPRPVGRPAKRPLW